MDWNNAIKPGFGKVLSSLVFFILGLYFSHFITDTFLMKVIYSFALGLLIYLICSFEERYEIIKKREELPEHPKDIAGSSSIVISSNTNI